MRRKVLVATAFVIGIPLAIWLLLGVSWTAFVAIYGHLYPVSYGGALPEYSETEDGYRTDGEGWDDVLDPLAAALPEVLRDRGYSGCDMVRVDHRHGPAMRLFYDDGILDAEVGIRRSVDGGASEPFNKQFETDYRDAAAFDKSLSLVAGGEDSHNAVFANAYADVVKIYAIRCVDAFYVEFRGSLRGCGDVDAAVAAMESFLDAVFSAEGE